MKKIWPLIILVALIIVYFVVQRRESSLVEPRHYDEFLQIDSTTVDRIKISKLGSAISLNRVGNTWYVINGDSYPADPAAVSELLGALANLNVRNMISENPEKQIQFQVDTLTGTTLQVYAGDNLVGSIVVGKMSNDFRHTYVRRSGEDEVYLADGLLTHMAGRTSANWKDKTIIDVPVDQVQTIDVRFGDEHYQLEMPDSLWEVSEAPFNESQEADQAAASALVTSLCGLKASDFATPFDSTAYDFTDAAYTAIITLTDGSSHIVEIAGAEEDANRRFARTPDKDVVFVIYKNVYDRIAKSIKDLHSEEKNS
jgi:hypothetical protein